MLKKYTLYLLTYSFLGWILERIINLIFLKEYLDNSVLFFPIQPLYGIGIVSAVFILNQIDKSKINVFIYYIIALIICIITTSLTEYIIGTSYEYFYHSHLWNYQDTFVCKNEYTCLLPTSIFGVISLITILYIHPIIDNLLILIPNLLYKILFFLFIVDIIITFTYRNVPIIFK